MFKKQAVCIATAAGAGMKSTIKDMADSMFFWGVPKTYKYGKGVSAISWDKVSDKKKAKIDKQLESLAGKIKRRNGKVKPGIKTKAFFFLMHIAQRKGISPIDKAYWAEKDWIGSKRPWK